MRKRIPLAIAKPPFVIPRFFRSLSKNPVPFPAQLSVQYWMIKTPEVMNMAAPISEKNRSKIEIYISQTLNCQIQVFELTDSLVDWSVHHVSSKKTNQNNRKAHESSINKHGFVMVCVLKGRIVVHTDTCQCEELKKIDFFSHKFIQLKSFKLINQ